MPPVLYVNVGLKLYDLIVIFPFHQMVVRQLHKEARRAHDGESEHTMAKGSERVNHDAPGRAYREEGRLVELAERVAGAVGSSESLDLEGHDGGFVEAAGVERPYPAASRVQESMIVRKADRAEESP